MDVTRVRAVVTMERVLNLLGFEPSSRPGAQWYGSCPLHEAEGDRRRRSFSAAAGCDDLRATPGGFVWIWSLASGHMFV
jgi:hypothetical protein